MPLDKDARFSLGSITREQIAVELNIAMCKPTFTTDDDRLTDSVCGHYAMEIGCDPEMTDMIAKDTAHSILGIAREPRGEDDDEH